MRVESTQESFPMMERVLLKASEWTASRVAWGSRTHFRDAAAAAAEQHPSAYPCGWPAVELLHFGAKLWWAESRVTRSTRWPEYLFSSASPGLVISLGITCRQSKQTSGEHLICLPGTTRAQVIQRPGDRLKNIPAAGTPPRNLQFY